MAEIDQKFERLLGNKVLPGLEFLAVSNEGEGYLKIPERFSPEQVSIVAKIAAIYAVRGIAASESSACIEAAFERSELENYLRSLFGGETAVAAGAVRIALNAAADLVDGIDKYEAILEDARQRRLGRDS